MTCESPRILRLSHSYACAPSVTHFYMRVPYPERNLVRSQYSCWSQNRVVERWCWC